MNAPERTSRPSNRTAFRRSTRLGAIAALTIGVGGAVIACSSNAHDEREGRNESALVQPLPGPAPTTIGAPRAVAPSDIGTRSGNCVYGNPAPGASGYSASVGTDEVERYDCPGCQPGGGATSADSASKGPVQNAESSPVVEVVFWGTAWTSTATSPTAVQVWQAMGRIFSSTYFDALAQYGVGQLTLDKMYVANDDPAPSYATSNDELSAAQARVFKVIDSTSVFANRTSNTIFLVMMPPTTTPPTDGLGCGSHEIQTEFNLGQINTANVGWTVFSDLDSMTATTTHELIEAITNPHGSVPGLNGWTMDRTFFGGAGENEIMDACNDQEDFLNGTMVQAYWSNNDHACVIPYPALPTITSLSQTSGPAAGGEKVTITGTSFDTQGATQVTVDGTAVSGVVCPTTTQCSFTMPAHADGSGVVGVTVSKYFVSNTVPFAFTFPCTYALGCGGGIVAQCTPDAAQDPMEVLFTQNDDTTTTALSGSGSGYLLGVPGVGATITACITGKTCNPPVTITPEQSPSGLSCGAPPVTPPSGGTCHTPACSCVGVWTGTVCEHVCPCGGEWPSKCRICQ